MLPLHIKTVFFSGGSYPQNPYFVLVVAAQHEREGVAKQHSEFCERSRNRFRAQGPEGVLRDPTSPRREASLFNLPGLRARLFYGLDGRAARLVLPVFTGLRFQGPAMSWPICVRRPPRDQAAATPAQTPARGCPATEANPLRRRGAAARPLLPRSRPTLANMRRRCATCCGRASPNVACSSSASAATDRRPGQFDAYPARGLARRALGRSTGARNRRDNHG
jgi:hypothetical protein